MKKKFILILIIVITFSCKNEKKSKKEEKKNKIEAVIEEIGDNYSTKPELIGEQFIKLFKEFDSPRIANPMNYPRFKKYFCSVEELRKYGKDSLEFGSEGQNYFTSISNSKYYGNINSEFSKLWRHLFKDRDNRIYIANGDLELLDFSYQGNIMYETKFIEGIVTIKINLYDYTIRFKTTSILLGEKYKLIGFSLY